MTRDAGTLRLFVDEVVIHVRGGRGGDGCVSFRREKFVPKGGPDGGDGGHGGSVYLQADASLNTLLDLAGRHHWHAENGRPGMGANCSGKTGQDLIVPVPAGTLVYDADSGLLLKDLVGHQQRVRVGAGGRGGFGNARFATSTNQAPREAQPGRPGGERRLRLELKLIADVGLVGLPNAGKSTLLSRLTRARPKIAPYPFTTREPHLGILELPGFRRLTLADLPGLIEGAHEGAGLGDVFLRHIERTRVIVHLIDLCPPEGSPSPLEAYRTIRGELAKYSPTLAARREIIVGNKLDLTGAADALPALGAAIGAPVLGISGVSGQALRELAERMWTVVEDVRAAEPPPAATPSEEIDLDAPAAPVEIGAVADDWDDSAPLGPSGAPAAFPENADEDDDAFGVDDEHETRDGTLDDEAAGGTTDDDGRGDGTPRRPREGPLE
ncbi:MAG: GTPase ObgE [Phycisphaerae bacterium]